MCMLRLCVFSCDLCVGVCVRALLARMHVCVHDVYVKMYACIECVTQLRFQVDDLSSYRSAH